MRATGTLQCTPRLRPQDEHMTARPFIENFSSGYMQRAMPERPRQGDHEPWLNPQHYRRDRKMFRTGAVDDGVMRFTRASPEHGIDGAGDGLTVGAAAQGLAGAVGSDHDRGGL